jgi:hypothetical protein
MRAAHDQLTEFMRTQVAERKSEIRAQFSDDISRRRNDAFSMLVKANEQEAGKLRMDDQELVCLTITIPECPLTKFLIC